MKLRFNLNIFAVLAVAALSMAPAVAADDAGVSWPMFGQNPANTASNNGENNLSIQTVGRLRPKWTFATTGDVSARAAVDHNIVFFPDWGGSLWALSTTNGGVIWSHKLSDYFPGAAAGSIHSRTTPAVSNGLVYVGTQEGSYLLAIFETTGQLLWKKQIESTDPLAILTTSPVVSSGKVYLGVASLAEGATLYHSDLSTYAARGSVVAVNALTGHIDWKTYMVPKGYTGGGVWGSNLVVDADRRTIFASTGDNYNHPASSATSSKPGMTFGACIANDTEANCLSGDDHVDSVLALDMWSGEVKWAKRLLTWNQPGIHNGSDDWNVDCILPLLGFPSIGPQCPTTPGPDYDFGSAPNEITYQTSHGPKTIIGAGQKSGIYYAFDPESGNLLWQNQVGPGSSLGGMEWGSASDGKRIYVAIANYYGIPHSVGNAGFWAALDPATGTVLWRTADPNGAIDLGPMAVANGVIYAASMAGAASAPTMFALNAQTGKVLWNYAAGSSVLAGASIVNGSVYWGSGYAHLGSPGFTGSATSGKFYAFSVEGH